MQKSAKSANCSSSANRHSTKDAQMLAHVVMSRKFAIVIQNHPFLLWRLPDLWSEENDTSMSIDASVSNEKLIHRNGL